MGNPNLNETGKTQPKSTEIEIRGCMENNGVYEVKRVWIRGGAKHWRVYRIADKGYAKFEKIVYPEVSVVDKKKEVWAWKLEPGQYLVVESVDRVKRYDLYVWYLTVEINKVCWWYWGKSFVGDVLDVKPWLELILEKRLGGGS